ncbi:MAG: hypothetical protein HY827_02030 [Actinobacteria bacterium]|nr:hypothetical protein [Actinomycetota bacterium]
MIAKSQREIHRGAFRVICAVAALVVALSPVWVESAQAGQYQMKFCESGWSTWSPVGDLGTDSPWQLTGDCVYGLSFGASASASRHEFRTLAFPPSNSLPATIERADLVLDGSNGLPFGKLQGFRLCAPVAVACPILTTTKPFVDQAEPERIALTVADGTLPLDVKQIEITAKCEAEVCPASPALVFRSLDLTIRDDDAPTLSYTPAEPTDFGNPGDYAKLKPGGWHPGKKIPLYFEATDPSLALASLDVSSPTLFARQRLVSTCWDDDHGRRISGECSFRTPDWFLGIPEHVVIDAAKLHSGPHDLELTVTDAAGNSSKPISLHFMVDRMPPPTLAGTTVKGINSDGWIYGDLAEISWRPEGETIPTTTNSGLAGISWRALPLTGGGSPVLTSGGFVAVDPETTSLPGLKLPNGRWKVVILLRDGAGNISGATNVDLSVDRTVFSAPEVSAPRWTGGPASGPLSWNPPANRSVSISGLCGYRQLINKDPDSDPGTEINATSQDQAADAISKLEAGDYWYHLRAVTCSGMGGVPVHIPIRVDRQAPVAALSVNASASGWVTDSYAVRLLAQDARSGVRLVRFAVDDGPWKTIDDDHAVIAVPAGTHRVTYGAEDQAGNRSALIDTTIRSDTTPPSAAIDAIDRSAPARISASVADADSGIESTWLEYRRFGPETGDWRSLGAPDFPGGQINSSAVPFGFFPDDALQPGRFELRVIAIDVAGHRTVSARRSDGSPALLISPLRASVGLDAGFAEHSRSNRCAVNRAKCKRIAPGLSTTAFVDYGNGAQVSGSLAAAHGEPERNAEVKLFRVDPSTGMRRLQGVSLTQRDGTFGFRVPAGPSRALIVRFAGSERLLPSERRLTLATRSRVSLGVTETRIGDRIVLAFRGRLATSLAAVPIGGKELTIQFRVRGAWMTFPTPEIRAFDRGRFNVSVKLAPSRATRYRFRAFVPVTSDWPFAEGHSRSIVTEIRP